MLNLQSHLHKREHITSMCVYKVFIWRYLEHINYDVLRSAKNYITKLMGQIAIERKSALTEVFT